MILNGDITLYGNQNMTGGNMSYLDYINPEGTLLEVGGDIDLNSNNLYGVGDMNATTFYGDGSQLTGVSTGTNLSAIIDNEANTSINMSGNNITNVDSIIGNNNNVRFDSDVELQDDDALRLGTSADTYLDWSTAQAITNTLVWGLGIASRSLIFADFSYINSDYDHVSQDSPTIFVQSVTDPDTNNTQWGSLAHDTNRVVLDSGTDAILFDDTTYTAGDSIIGDPVVGTEVGEMYGSGTNFIINTTNPVMFTNNVEISGNLSLGQKITFALSETIDNILDGWIAITGALKVSGDFAVNSNNLYVNTTSNKTGIGTSFPNAPLEIDGILPGAIGGFASGLLHITNKDSAEFSGSVITGHNSNNTNTQLWYLGSTSSVDNNVGFLNRQNASMTFSTDNAFRMIIDPIGNVGIGTSIPTAKLNVDGNTNITGYTNLGNDAPAVKFKKISGTTDADSETSVAHGLTLSKILSVDIIIVGSTISVAPNYLTSGDTNYYAYHLDSTNVVMTSVQAGVQSGAYTILIAHEE